MQVNRDHVSSNTYMYFDITRLPKLLEAHLPKEPAALADFGCGTGPYFYILKKMGVFSNHKPVYAIDIQKEKLDLIEYRFKDISVLNSTVEDVRAIEDNSLDFVISTMVLEHVENEEKFLREISRVLKPNSKAFITTVFKKKWAWYFRKNQFGFVLDITHKREYFDLVLFKKTLTEKTGFSQIMDIELSILWFSFLDPILKRICNRPIPEKYNKILDILKKIKIPIIGYYTLAVVLKK